MKYSRILVLLATLAGQVVAQQPVPEAQLGAIPSTDESMGFPKWENGYFVSFDVPGPSLTPKIYIFDNRGSEITSAAIGIPDAAYVALLDVAISPSGTTIATAGSVQGKNGSVAGFIYWLDRQTGKAQITRTNPFIPRHVSFALDNTIWAAGWEIDGAEPTQAGDILRQYDISGRLLKSALPRSSFPSAGRRRPASLSFLSVTPERVGFYTDVTAEWVEISPESGAVLGRWSASSARGDGRVRGVGLSNAGEVYITVKGRSTARTTANSVIYRLDHATRTWQRRDDLSSGASLVLGSDGKQILISQKPPQTVWVAATND